VCVCVCVCVGRHGKLQDIEFVVLGSFLGVGISQLSPHAGSHSSLFIVNISGLPSAYTPASSVSVHLIACGRTLEVRD